MLMKNRLNTTTAKPATLIQAAPPGRQPAVARGVQVGRVDHPGDEGDRLLGVPAPEPAPGRLRPDRPGDHRERVEREGHDSDPVGQPVERVRAPIQNSGVAKAGPPAAAGHGGQRDRADVTAIQNDCSAGTTARPRRRARGRRGTISTDTGSSRNSPVRRSAGDGGGRPARAPRRSGRPRGERGHVATQQGRADRPRAAIDARSSPARGWSARPPSDRAGRPAGAGDRSVRASRVAAPCSAAPAPTRAGSRPSVDAARRARRRTAPSPAGRRPARKGTVVAYSASEHLPLLRPLSASRSPVSRSEASNSSPYPARSVRASPDTCTTVRPG